MTRRRIQLSPEELQQEIAIAQRKGIPVCDVCGHPHRDRIMCPLCDCGHRFHIVPRHEMRRRRRMAQKAREREIEFTKRVRQETKRVYKKRRTRSMKGK